MFRLQLVTASKVVSVSEWCVCVCDQGKQIKNRSN